jgi:hypothetical protein
MKKTLGLAAAALLTLSLTACSGGDDEDAYCDSIRDAKDSLEGADFDQLDQQTFDDLTQQLDDISENAPSDVEDEWQTVTEGFDEIESLFNEAGLTFDDLEQLQGGDLPEGVDLQKLQELAPQFQEIAEGNEIPDAIETIQTDAEDRCDITFDEDSGN